MNNDNNKETIGILLSLCSRNMDWSIISDIDLFKFFLPSLFNTISNKYNIKLFIGYDDNDEFIINNLEQIKKRIHKISTFTELQNCNGNPCKAWNTLLKENIDKADYFYQIGTDIILKTKNWDTHFINILKKNKNVGVCSSSELSFWVGRYVENKVGILENVFFHKTHYNIFNCLYPDEFKNWFSDDYITDLYYGINKCFICPYINYLNTHRVGQQATNRYNPDLSIHNKWRDLVKRDSKKFNNIKIKK